jgi:hypothetical protein
MKITVDTKEDSVEDIRKVMQILSHFSEQKEAQHEQVNTAPMMSMFGEASPRSSHSTSTSTQNDTPPDFSSFMNLANQVSNKNTEEQKEPKIEFF